MRVTRNNNYDTTFVIHALITLLYCAYRTHKLKGVLQTFLVQINAIRLQPHFRVFSINRHNGLSLILFFQN